MIKGMDTSTTRPDGLSLTTDDPTFDTQTSSLALGAAPACSVPSEDGETDTTLAGDALEAWRSYLQSHATILRMLDAELVSEHAITTRDYEVLLYLAQAPDRKLPMSALAESTMLTRSGITRLVDGLVAGGFIERTACLSDARVSYAQLTDQGMAKLRSAGCTHVGSIRRLFLEHFTAEETSRLASLLGRLPGAQRGGACTVE
jgi:DNA-binding MarR family transcriptional regulator